MPKRFEKMTKERIMEFVAGCNDRECANCPASNNGICTYSTTARCIAAYLYAEITTKKRWQTITSDEDIVRLHQEFTLFCGKMEGCNVCPYNRSSKDDCYDFFLCEEVEVTV